MEIYEEIVKVLKYVGQVVACVACIFIPLAFWYTGVFNRFLSQFFNHFFQ